MPNIFVESLLIGWDRNLDYVKKMMADLSDEQIVVQPQPEMNHPAWILSHLNAYHPVIVSLVRGQTPTDPKDHQFGMQSAPVADLAVYGSKDQVLGAYIQGHDEVTAALQAADASAMERPMPIERWQKPFPKVGSILGYLMLVHESTHLGQLSAWRRVQGMGRV